MQWVVREESPPGSYFVPRTLVFTLSQGSRKRGAPPRGGAGRKKGRVGGRGGRARGGREAGLGFSGAYSQFWLQVDLGCDNSNGSCYLSRASCMSGPEENAFHVFAVCFL